MARFENHKYSIEEALRERFYIVSDYRREYVWTGNEVHQLLEDIGEQIDAGTTRERFGYQQQYLGTNTDRVA